MYSYKDIFEVARPVDSSDPPLLCLLVPGKTEASKYVMRYLITVANALHSDEGRQVQCYHCPPFVYPPYHCTSDNTTADQMDNRITCSVCLWPTGAAARRPDREVPATEQSGARGLWQRQDAQERQLQVRYTNKFQIYTQKCIYIHIPGEAKIELWYRHLRGLQRLIWPIE